MSFHDAREVPHGHEIESDLCIVGSGAAGLSVVSQFLVGSHRVTLLESGGFEPDPEIQSLNRGDMAGIQDFPLDQTRLRYWGGTTNHWTAWLHPLKAIDFEPRSWLPESGWPFGLAELQPWYDRAMTFFGIAPEGFDPKRARPADAGWPFAPELVTSHLFQVLPVQRRRLGTVWRPRIASARNVSAFVHANVLSIDTDRSGRRVIGLRVGSDGGRRLTARASAYVIAAGGIENARLLLLSDGARPAGVGNDRDLVGRYYANHLPAPRAAELCPSIPGLGTSAFSFTLFRDCSVGRYVTLNEQTQRAHQLLNCQFSSLRGPVRDPGSGLDRSIRDWAATVDGWATLSNGRSAAGSSRGAFPVHAIAEPAANRASRVRLGSDTDQFGQRRVVLDWQVSAFDAPSVEKSLGLLGQAAGAGGLGRIRLPFPEGGFRFADLRGSYHHMGTTRMHDDPARGVVDRHCRVHGVENLFVAGSSVFPTFGTVNPTLTISALALRLADHVRGGLR